MNDLFAQTTFSNVINTWNPNRHYMSEADYRVDPFVNSGRYQRYTSIQAINNQRDLINERISHYRSYDSISAYKLDPNQLGRTREISENFNIESYLSEEKAFYPITPYNVTPKHSPVCEFDTTILGQTNASDLIKRSHLNTFGVVSLAKAVSSLILTVGALHNCQTKQRLGTCTIISENLVLTARHVVEGKTIPNLMVRFDNIKVQNLSGFYSTEVGLDYVVEDDPLLDYAIIKLKNPKNPKIKLTCANLNIGDCFPGSTALLHYPLEKELQVSVNVFDISTSQYSIYMRGFHDSDYGSSGGSYFDPLSRFTALHIGVESTNKTFNLSRYAITLQNIIQKYPNSLLSKFANVPPNNFFSISSNDFKIRKNYLQPHNRSFLIEKEGKKSQKVFTELLGNNIKTDKKISLTKAKIVAFSEKNLNYLITYYGNIFDEVYEECLYITGRHVYTKQYAIKGYIESDHLIPHNVWASTNLVAMKKFVKGRGTRPGENDMPAITIPYDLHRNLYTTGNSYKSQSFCNQLTIKCNLNKVHKAFIMCLEDYKRVGILDGLAI